MNRSYINSRNAAYNGSVLTPFCPSLVSVDAFGLIVSEILAWDL